MKRLFSRGVFAVMVLIAVTGWLPQPLERDALAADTDCGGQPCVETVICAAPSVVKCSDWNNGSTDGWSISPYGGGLIKTGVGYAGSRAWEAVITQGVHGSIYFDTPVAGVGYGPLHVRFYVKFSPGYIFMCCGLQKMMYLESNGGTYWRVLLGVTRANEMGGSFANLPNTVGIFGFDYIGHIVRLPDGGGDTPVLIYPDQWYSVEIMAHWTSRTQNVVRVWVNGQLQMTRSNYDDGVWTTAHSFNTIADSSHHGGADPVYLPIQTQYVYKDNHVISKSYIGPLDRPDQTPPSPPTGLTVR